MHSQGTESEIAHALFTVSEAVDRYKALCEGAYAGVQHFRLDTCCMRNALAWWPQWHWLTCMQMQANSLQAALMAMPVY